VNYRLLNQICIFIIFLIAPLWLKWPFAPAPFTGGYVLGFVLSVLILLSIILWFLDGLQGWRNLFRGYLRMTFLGALLLLTGWSVISQAWAFGANLYPGMAETAALQLCLVTGFVIVLIATAPPPRVILFALILSMLVQGTIGTLQVYFQQSINLGWLGEFTISPIQDGTSILEADGMRWMRPYGLTPHPNIFAGVIILGIFASLAFVLEGKRPFLSISAFGFGFFCLLLSFSRGAWIGFAAAAVLVLPLLMRKTYFWRRILPVFGLSILIGSIFLWAYQPLLLSRTGLSEENTEQRSISDRLVYMDIAWDAIATHPMQGVGAGNFPWYASNYLYFRTDYDLKGNNVHNVYLTIWSELGLIGLVLFLLMLAAGTIVALQNRSVERIALLAGFLAWAVVAMVDHYSWTLLLTQTLWLGGLAVAIAQDAKASYNEGKEL
jgi:putative inorganic carbon (hco3(-)) transporter